MSTSRRVAENTAVQVAGRAAVLVLGAASILVITRYLGAEDYGKLGLAFAYLQIFGVVADAGLFTVVVREIARAPERTAELVGTTLVLRLALSLAVILVAGLLSLVLPYDADVRWAILIAGAATLLGLLNSAMTAVFQAELRMGRAVAGDVIGRAASLAAAGLVAALDLGFHAVVATAAVGMAVTLAVTVRLVRPSVAVRPRWEPPLARGLLATSLPLGLALAVNELYFRIDMFVISLFEDYDQVGLYSLAYRIFEMAASFPSVLLGSVFAVLSGYVATADERVDRTIQMAFDALVLVGLPLAAGGLVVSADVAELAGGESFRDAGEPLAILLCAGALALVNGLFGYALIARDRQRDILVLSAGALAFNVALNFALVPSYGIAAAAAATAASEVVMLAGAYVLMRRRFAFFPSLGALVRAVPAAAVMAGALWLARDAPVLVTVPAGALVYAVVAWLTGAVDRETVRRLRAT